VLTESCTQAKTPLVSPTVIPKPNKESLLPVIQIRTMHFRCHIFGARLPNFHDGEEFGSLAPNFCRTELLVPNFCSVC